MNGADIYDRELAITYLTPERFAAMPQIGLPISQEWHSLFRWLSTPTFGETKRDAGAWCPCALEGGRVRGGSGPVSLLVGDVDDCEADGLDRSVRALSCYAGAVVPTFSATAEKSKHRILLLPSRPILAVEFPIAWSKMARELAADGITLDRGCKNLNRLYFACVTRSRETWLGARQLTGAPVDVDRMVAAARVEEAALEAGRERARAQRPAPRPAPMADSARRERYISTAIDREAANIRGAGEGGRHEALLRAAWALARLPELSESDIGGALIPAFVSVAGEPRRREAERAVHDAVSARKAVA